MLEKINPLEKYTADIICSIPALPEMSEKDLIALSKMRMDHKRDFLGVINYLIEDLLKHVANLSEIQSYLQQPPQLKLVSSGGFLNEDKR